MELKYNDNNLTSFVIENGVYLFAGWDGSDTRDVT